MNRAQRRALKKKKGTTEEEKKLSSKIFLFQQLPDECNACGNTFDKTDHDMVQSWTVVVHGENEKVTLFCPVCITKTKTFVEEKTDADSSPITTSAP